MIPENDKLPVKIIIPKSKVKVALPVAVDPIAGDSLAPVKVALKVVVVLAVVVLLLLQDNITIKFIINKEETINLAF